MADIVNIRLISIMPLKQWLKCITVKGKRSGRQLAYEGKEEVIRAVIQTVDEPELPSVSVNDPGMVHEIMVSQRLVSVTMVPTFVGCPALDFIERDVKAAVERIPWVDGCQVEFTFRHQW